MCTSASCLAWPSPVKGMAAVAVRQPQNETAACEWGCRGRARFRMDCRECVSSCHIRWLGYTAFRRVLGRKQARRAPAAPLPRRNSAPRVLSAGALRAQRAHPCADETLCGASSCFVAQADLGQLPGHACCLLAQHIIHAILNIF